MKNSPDTNDASGHAARLASLLTERIHLDFLSAIPGGGTAEEQAADLTAFLKKLSRTDTYRDRNARTLDMIESGMLERIVRGVIAAESELAVRIAAEDRFKLDAAGAVNFIAAALMLRDIVYTKGPMVYDAYRFDMKEYDAAAKAFLDETHELCEKLMPSVSDVFFSIVFKSVIRFMPDDTSVPAMSRLIIVLDHFSKVLPLTVAGDAGTLSSARSAACILAANASFFGLDPLVTAELAHAAERIA